MLIPADLLSATTISAGGGSTLAFLNDRSPAITVQPWDRTVASGTNVTLRALTVGQAPVRYQWYWNGQALPGATGNFLALPQHPAHAERRLSARGHERLRRRHQRRGNSDRHRAASEARRLGAAANGFRFSFTSLPAVLYIVEFKDTLGLGHWTELERRFGVGGLEIVTDPSALGAARFYRVRALYAPPPRVTLHRLERRRAKLLLCDRAGRDLRHPIQGRTSTIPPGWNCRAKPAPARPS